MAGKTEAIRVTASKHGPSKGKRMAVSMSLRRGEPSGFISTTHFEPKKSTRRGGKGRGSAGFAYPQMMDEKPMETPHASLQDVKDHLDQHFGDNPEMPNANGGGAETEETEDENGENGE